MISFALLRKKKQFSTPRLMSRFARVYMRIIILTFIGSILTTIQLFILSTVSSLFNSGALVILQDFIRPFKPNLSEKHATIISKILVLVLGAVAIVLVLFARYFGAGLFSVSKIKIFARAIGLNLIKIKKNKSKIHLI